ncbi:hypothetical protein AB0M95_28770 [Sphaerisporangium sp. NPDC051017]|uniref:hypothetical protein n=1 Tax=Sphaerisporangium sp. NPDC051017 TaxID=3154636 RepID=UPI0034260EBE
MRVLVRRTAAVLLGLCLALGSAATVSGPANAYVGPNVQTGAALGMNADGRLEAFVVSYGTMWHIAQGSNGWGFWDIIRDAPRGFEQHRPAVALNKGGWLEVFAVGTDGNMYHSYQASGRIGGWSPWYSMGAPSGLSFSWARVVVGTNKDGRLEVFALGSNNELWHAWQLTAGGAWSGWASLGGQFEGEALPAVGKNADGRLEVFITGGDGHLWHLWQLSPGGGWSGWLNEGGSLQHGANTGPAVGVNQDGRLELFATGTDGRTYHKWQGFSGGWSGWASMGSGGSFPVVERNQDGRLELFTNGGSHVLHAWQVAPNSGWSGFGGVGGQTNPYNQPSVIRNLDGRLEVFAHAGINKTGAIIHSWQSTPGGAWSGWIPLEGS